MSILMSRLNNGQDPMDKRSIRIEKPSFNSSENKNVQEPPKRLGFLFRGLLTLSLLVAILSFAAVVLLMRDYVFP